MASCAKSRVKCLLTKERLPQPGLRKLKSVCACEFRYVCACIHDVVLVFACYPVNAHCTKLFPEFEGSGFTSRV